jgi:hypothetical protein
LIVSEVGSRKWVLRFTWRGRAKEMGLGSAASVPLADAREKAASARRKIAQGLNPIDERKRDGGIPSFGEIDHEGFNRNGWRTSAAVRYIPVRLGALVFGATGGVLRREWIDARFVD